MRTARPITSGASSPSAAGRPGVSSATPKSWPASSAGAWRARGVNCDVVHPFTTHAMSGLGTAERDYTSACRGAAISEGLAVQGEQVRDAGPPAVTSWLTRIGLAGEDQR